jgi:hypothetical protein
MSSHAKRSNTTAAADGPVLPIKTISVSGLRKLRKKRAKRKPLVGIVPKRTTAIANRGLDLVFPSDGRDTNIVNHGGQLASGIAVEFLFWGSFWQQPANAALVNGVMAKCATLFKGPYFSALRQYGVTDRPTIREGLIVLNPGPPGSFDDDDVGDMVWTLIDDNHFPEPEDAGGRIFYVVIMPPGQSYTGPSARGAHSHQEDDDILEFDNHDAWVAWIGFNEGTVDGITLTLSHELVETMTDPNGDAWYVDSIGSETGEIGDFCTSPSKWGFVQGIFVDSYWSKGANACVIRQTYGFEVSVVARTPENLDLFVVGNDGRVYTSWWSAGNDWSGVNDDWRPIGGFFPVGASISAVARTPDNLDLFVVGNDGRVYTSWWSAGNDWSGVNDNWRPLGGFFPAGAPVSAVARTPDNLDLFVIAKDGRVYTSWWSAGNDWSGVNNNWRPIGGFFPVGVQVSAVARTPDNLDLFVTGNDGRVYTSWWSAGNDWSGVNDNWRSIGGFFPVGSPVSAVARTTDNLDLFVVGNDGRVYTSWWSAGNDWSGVNDNWRSIGGFFPIGTSVSAVARTPDNLDLFVAGNDGRTYTSWWSAGNDWSGVNDDWRSIGGFFPMGTPVSAVARTSQNLLGMSLSSTARSQNNLDLFVVGDDGRVYTSWWSAGNDWSGLNDDWRSIGGFFPPGSDVSAVARSQNNLDLFVLGNDGRVYTSWWSAGNDWSGINDDWRSIGGFFPPGSDVSAVARSQNNLDLFVLGNDGRVYTSWWSAGNDWSGINDDWRSIGGFFPPGAVVSAVARSQDNLDLFVVGNDGRVYTSWWSAGNDWSGVNDDWRPIGGFFPPGSHVSAVARSQNNLDLFVLGHDGRVYTSWWSAGNDWSGVNDDWRPIGGFFPPGTKISAIARSQNNLDLFVLGNDGRVYTSWWFLRGDWSGVNDNWRSIGGFFPPGSKISAIARSQNNLDLFVLGNDSRAYSSWWSAGNYWSGVNDDWRPIGGFFPSPGTNLDLFVIGNDGRVYTSWWSPGNDWSGVNDDWRSIGGFFPTGV